MVLEECRFHRLALNIGSFREAIKGQGVSGDRVGNQLG